LTDRVSAHDQSHVPDPACGVHAAIAWRRCDQPTNRP